MSLRLLVSCSIATGLVACAPPPLSSRAIEIASVMADADAPLIRARPELVAGKYELMASDTFSFYRGNLAIFLNDWESGDFGLATSGYALPAGGNGDAAPLATGDPHPENFGLLQAADGSFALEPNDFDSADRAPYLWDVRRLVAGVALAARVANPDDPAAQMVSAAAASDVARAAAASYARSIAALADGAARERFDMPDGQVVLGYLFEKAAEDARGELDDDTEIVNGARRLKRGVLSGDDPTNTFADLPADVIEALPQLLSDYRATLIEPPPAANLTLIDAVREFGSGVASWPRVRLILLVRGATDDVDDDVLLEVKELADSDLLPRAPPGRFFADNEERVRVTSRTAWATPVASPLWGTATLLGLPCQVRLEAKAQRTLRTDKLTGDRGTPAALEEIATTLGALLARVHASPLTPGERPASAIATAIGGDIDGFADEQAEVGAAYANRVAIDQELFAQALLALGTNLGLPVTAADAPPPDLAALYGKPPVGVPDAGGR